MRTAFVAEFPVVQHRHDDGQIVSVRLKRRGGEHRAVCSGCQTEFVYRKPTRSRTAHYKSPLLPPVKGNWDSSDTDD